MSSSEVNYLHLGFPIGDRQNANAWQQTEAPCARRPRIYKEPVTKTRDELAVGMAVHNDVRIVLPSQSLRGWTPKFMTVAHVNPQPIDFDIDAVGKHGVPGFIGVAKYGSGGGGSLPPAEKFCPPPAPRGGETAHPPPTSPAGRIMPTPFSAS